MHPSQVLLRPRPISLPVLAVAGIQLVGSPAAARVGGIAAEGCSGCHGGTGEISLSLSTSPETFGPDADVEVRLTIDGSIASAGVFVTTKGVGSLQPLSGQGLTSVSNGLVHSQPKGASGGQVEFRFGYRSPGSAGAVRFFVYSLGANGNGQRSGDSPKNGFFDRVFGCEGQTFYADEDEDGFGRDTFSQMACAGAAPAGFVATGGDCVDYDPSVNPGATELCNLKDDDCNGQTDENALPVQLWPDADGDGYYEETQGEPVEGCVGLAGYAALGGDCDPSDPAIHPEAQEICNYYDENCDGEVDERSHAVCGVGWCSRESPTCNPDECKPGAPRAEECNSMDDDCDGQIDDADDGPLCPTGQDCAEGACVGIGSTGAPGGGGSSTGSPSGGAASPPPRSTPVASSCSVAWQDGNLHWLGLLGVATAAVAFRRRRRPGAA